MSNPLHPLTLPLRGSRLIEASAGTGKTWTIAALYLRLVLGHGEAALPPITPEQILVMTFTRAATRELAERIRARLAEAAACFRGERTPAVEDTFLQQLLADYSAGERRLQAAWRLSNAAESMDMAAIFTIDAWCQRMLREHAFDSGSLFDEKLIADERTWTDLAVRDVWRQQIYPLTGTTLDALLAIWPTVESLKADVQRRLPRLESAVFAPYLSLAAEWREHQDVQRDAVQTLKATWATWIIRMSDWLRSVLPPSASSNPFNANMLKPHEAADWCATLGEWCEDPAKLHLELPDQAWKRLAPGGLESALKKGGQIDIPADWGDWARFREALQQIPDPVPPLRRAAVLHVQHRLQALKAAARTFGFRDMLERLDQALAGPSGAQLRKRILQQYPVALVDEFQDTSSLQFSLFDRLYQIAANDMETAILLIGDPKQSIYAFRGADIQSYIRAREATAGRHYVLTTNHRSVDALVAGVNQLFLAAEDRKGHGAFHFREDTNRNPVPFLANDAHGRADCLLRGNEPVPAMEIVFGTAVESKTDLLAHFAQACAEHVATLLNDPQVGFHEQVDSNEKRLLRPADIAILIRDRTEAAAVRQALRQRGIVSVYLSDKDSVLATPEALDLLRWLRAVAEPRDGRLARAAFATALLDATIPEMAALATEDVVFEARLELLQQLHQIWRRQGVLPMLRQTLHRLALPSRWLAKDGGERRLTNFLHLAEILQDASVLLEGEQALIRWLAEAIADSQDTDEAIVRLESEADLVQVVTIHKAKGLEYPIVYVPFATSFRAAKEEEAFSSKADPAADPEKARLQEDLRLLYVAVTRARHALWLGVGAMKVGKSPKCVLHRSAMGYLLGATMEQTDAGAIPELLAQVFPPDPAWSIQPVVEIVPCTRFQAHEVPPVLTAAPLYTGVFERDWGISSFSGMVRDLAALPAETHPLQISMEEESAVPAQVLPDLALQDAARHRFPRGSLPGKFLHEQLAWLAEEGFALAGNETLRDRLQQRCTRQGWGHRAEDVCTWLEEAVTTPLPGVGAALRDIRHFLAEMEFWFPVTAATTEAVDALCTQHLLPGVPRPALTPRRLRGLLMGFADLVLLWEGRYWVVDYKSNALGANDAAYGQDTLEAAVAQHRYEVQAILYLLALHRLLRSRLGAEYEPSRQLGGAMDWFLRGIAGPASGACLLPVNLDLLDSLDAVFRAEEAE